MGLCAGLLDYRGRGRGSRERDNIGVRCYANCLDAVRLTCGPAADHLDIPIRAQKHMFICL